ncbi:hypothetical protein [Halomonas sp. GD1P12]|uniref:hypothetical protein n=1 Tax=Halomonas sp. GD1P12 TaxID=2982691 RepID=UPI0021E423AE|nr:hypothetical protein [Halomonas sp. GD1P12]UYF98864.1 hypothetical protein OCT39_11565 [Halomonas sp. GD1P12]
MNDIENNFSRFLELPYSSRQLIVVTDDVIVKAAEQEERRAVQLRENGLDWKKITESIVFDVLPVSLGRTIAEVTREAIKAWGRARDDGLLVLPVGNTIAKLLSFPPGHPRDGVLYIGHPALPKVYYTLADFHRVTFEHKFCEATDLLMSLGATSIRVEHVSGWSRDFSSRISVPLGEAESKVGAEAASSSKSGSQLLFEARLSGAVTPSIPKDLVWYEHEPTWQSIAKGRKSYGLQDFSLSVSYEDDFGVNAGLKAAISKTGLEIGGKFEDHKSTIWRLEGKFKDIADGT